jgi:cytoskeletal protein CcmA (bactofilin family)
VIAYLMRGNQTSGASDVPEVAISGEVLNSLGVSRTPVTNQGVELTIGPNSKFSGKVAVGGDVSIAGQMQLNNTLNASKIVAGEMQGGRTALSQLDVNGDTNLGKANISRDLSVGGAARLQGDLQVAKLLTVSGNANIAGNLAVGGTLSVRNFQAASLTSETTLTIGGHIVTRGDAPTVSAGGAVGSNGTVSISGNDTAGTVAVNTGVGAGSGVLANISFTRNYGTTPHVVITPVGMGGSFYVNRSASGFSINANEALPPAGIAFDYIVVQ